MPFELKNAPSTFQSFMDITMTVLTRDLCMVYLDDIIIFNSEGKEDHVKKLRQVLERLRNVNVKLKPKKCNFMLKNVKYLGHIITQHEVLPDPAKIHKIQNFPIQKKFKRCTFVFGLGKLVQKIYSKCS